MISVIIPTARPKYLAHCLQQFNNQTIQELCEPIIIQESDSGFDEFNFFDYPIQSRILRQKLCNNNGATARDRGVKEAKHEYVVFWDDDNIYHPHALATLYATTYGHDVGLVQAKHHNLIIPINTNVSPGDVDTMCFCVKREIALKVKWDDGNGRYNDYRWISKILKITNDVRFVPIQIGIHL